MPETYNRLPVGQICPWEAQHWAGNTASSSVDNTLRFHRSCRSCRGMEITRVTQASTPGPA